MRNQQIRLTESDLHFIVEESVRNILIQEGFFGNMWNGVKNVAGGVADLAKAGGNAIGGMYYNGQANGQIQKLNQMKQEYEQMQQQYQQKIQQIDQQIQQLQQKAQQKQQNMNQNMKNFKGRMAPQNYQTPNLGGVNQQQQPQQQPQQTQQQMQVPSQQQQVKPRQKRTVKKQQPMQQSQLPQ